MGEKIRLDKWLWHARFFKTRVLATKTVTSGSVRLNSVKVAKAATQIAPGDVLTFNKGDDVKIIQVELISKRRGPAPEAQTLYTDLSPPPAPRVEYVPNAPGFEGKGRPSKKDRRIFDLSQRKVLE
ncbi:MAG: RNA-binding S4 domain-containing protein [Paracoccaceae bacterium]|nr:RNA-binding S4 domain-containing protein [Paracoccaceae bacterium]